MTDAHVYMENMHADARFHMEAVAKRNAAWFGTSTTLHDHTRADECDGKCTIIRGDTGVGATDSHARWRGDD